MPRPRKLVVEKYLNDEQTAKLEGKWIDLSYVKHPVIRSNVDVYYKDEDGKEMHKSAGNAIWFDDAAEKMGVDVMRWMYVRQNVENNLLFGYNKADDIRKRLIGFWNIYSFFCTYANVDNFQPNKNTINSADYNLLDNWIIAKTNLLIKESHKHYDNFEADKLLKKIELV